MTDSSLLADQQRLLSIFHPHLMKMVEEVREADTRFVHYTTADAAMNILRTGEVWLRKTSCMSDYMEVKHGLDCLVNAFRGEVGAQLIAALNRLGDGVADEVVSLFDGWAPHLEHDTYIACLSEHESAEDAHGRLSMWRAFSKSTGVALVLKNTPFLADDGPSGVYSSPVLYLDAELFETEMKRLVERIGANENFLRIQSREKVTNAVFNVFKLTALCIKHPGFIEEKEWRIIYVPQMERSPHVSQCVESVNGTPQPICKLLLKELTDCGTFGIEIPEILDRIIIGPTEFSYAIHEAFKTLLADAGVDNPTERVHISGIPLRS